MTDTLSSSDLRRWATQCLNRADDSSGSERDRFLRMYSSLLSLAETADWLGGTPTGAAEMQSTA